MTERPKRPNTTSVEVSPEEKQQLQQLGLSYRQALAYTLKHHTKNDPLKEEYRKTTQARVLTILAKTRPPNKEDWDKFLPQKHRYYRQDGRPITTDTYWQKLAHYAKILGITLTKLDELVITEMKKNGKPTDLQKRK